MASGGCGDSSGQEKYQLLVVSRGYVGKLALTIQFIHRKEDRNYIIQNSFML
uniref:Uncharacterized protein n=1 Tax=Urocitellus parryii TaxID=9999 RepID=A0A8D2KF99_UROPR